MWWRLVISSSSSAHYFFFFPPRGLGLEGEKKITSLRNNSLTLTCSFFRAREIGGFSLEPVDTFSPCDYTRSHQHLTRGFRAHGSAIYKHHPGIPETYVTAESTGFVCPWARRNQAILFIVGQRLSGSDGVLHQRSPKSRPGNTQYAAYRSLQGRALL